MAGERPMNGQNREVVDARQAISEAQSDSSPLALTKGDFALTKNDYENADNESDEGGNTSNGDEEECDWIIHQPTDPRPLSEVVEIQEQGEQDEGVETDEEGEDESDPSKWLSVSAGDSSRLRAPACDRDFDDIAIEETHVVNPALADTLRAEQDMMAVCRDEECYGSESTKEEGSL